MLIKYAQRRATEEKTFVIKSQDHRREEKKTGHRAKSQISWFASLFQHKDEDLYPNIMLVLIKRKCKWFSDTNNSSQAWHRWLVLKIAFPSEHINIVLCGKSIPVFTQMELQKVPIHFNFFFDCFLIRAIWVFSFVVVFASEFWEVWKYTISFR